MDNDKPQPDPFRIKCPNVRYLAKTIISRLGVRRRDIEDYAEFLRTHLG